MTLFIPLTQVLRVQFSLILLLLIAQAATGRGRRCKQNLDDQSGFISLGNVWCNNNNKHHIRELNIGCIEDCSSRCRNDAICEAFEFVMEQRTCELIFEGNVTGVSRASTSNGSRCFIRDRQNQITGGCKTNDDCQGNLVCQRRACVNPCTAQNVFCTYPQPQSVFTQDGEVSCGCASHSDCPGGHTCLSIQSFSSCKLNDRWGICYELIEQCIPQCLGSNCSEISWIDDIQQQAQCPTSLNLGQGVYYDEYDPSIYYSNIQIDSSPLQQEFTDQNNRLKRFADSLS